MNPLLPVMLHIHFIGIDEALQMCRNDTDITLFEPTNDG